MKSFLNSILIVVIVLGAGVILFKYWPYLFARTVTGVIADVQRVAMPVAVVSSAGHTSARDLFSFAVGVRTDDGEIVTASSEDRQWAVAKAGQCVEAKFFPYPPWQFDKSGTYFGARLLKLHVCDSGKMVMPEAAASDSANQPTKTDDLMTTDEAAAAAAAAGAEPQAESTGQ